MKTKHAIIRGQQRGIRENIVDMVLEYGVPSYKPGGATAWFIPRATANREISRLKRLIVLIERSKQKIVVQSDTDITLTVYHKR